MSQSLLRDRIVEFVNRTLLKPGRAPVSADTPLFEQGALDSMQVLDLIAFVEAETGRQIPDSAIRLESFRTASVLAETALRPAISTERRAERIWSRTRSRRKVHLAASTDIEAEMHEWGRELAARDVVAEHVVPLRVLARAGYLRSFPGRAVASDGSFAIPPAACLQCYGDLSDRTLSESPLVLSLANQCARGDEVADAAHGRMRHFSMREIVVVGSPTEVERARRALMHRAQTYLTRLDLAATMEVATDPFHVPADRGKLALQRLRALKYELRMPVAGESIAVASFNYHEDYFGTAFGISLPDGSAAHTACVAFGLERWNLAVREQLGGGTNDMAISA